MFTLQKDRGFPQRYWQVLKGGQQVPWQKDGDKQDNCMTLRAQCKIKIKNDLIQG